MTRKLLGVTFVEQIDPEHYQKATVISNVHICRTMTLILCQEAFNRGNGFEVKIEQK